jgi:hypothetical protein
MKNLSESSIVLIISVVIATVAAFVFHVGAVIYLGFSILCVLYAILAELGSIRRSLHPRYDVTFHPQAHLSDLEKQAIMRAASEYIRKERERAS